MGCDDNDIRDGYLPISKVTGIYIYKLYTGSTSYRTSEREDTECPGLWNPGSVWGREALDQEAGKLNMLGCSVQSVWTERGCLRRKKRTVAKEGVGLMYGTGDAGNMYLSIRQTGKLNVAIIVVLSEAKEISEVI